MKYTTIFFLLFCFLRADSQLPTFNRIHPINFQSPPYDYLAIGALNDVFEINELGLNFDGYLLFGTGILENPTLVSNYQRALSIKVNNIGDGMWSNRYSAETDTLSSAFGSYTKGTLFINHNGIITGPLSYAGYEGDFLRFFRNLAQFDNSGLLTNEIFIDSSYNDLRYVSAIEDFRDSSYLLIGGFRDSLDFTNGIRPDAYASKLDTLGHIIWEKYYENTYLAMQIIPSLMGGYWIYAMEYEGFCSGTSEYEDSIVIIKIDSEGDEEARWELDNYCGGETATIIEKENGELLLIGKVNEVELIAQDYYSGYFFSTILEYTDGVINEVAQRITYHHDTISSYISASKQVSDQSGYVSAGGIWNVEWAQYLGYVMKINNERELVWKRTYNYFPLVENVFNGWNYIKEIKETSDGGFVCVGEIREHAVHPNPQLYVPWVFKTDEYGCLEPGCQFVGTEDILVGLENTMTVFPNPVEDIATISFGKENLSQLSDLLSTGELIVFDINGKEIFRTNTRSVVSEGQLQINTQSWPSGIYLAQLISGSKWMDGVKIVKR